VRFLCTVEHTLMGVGCILLGTNTAQYRIWDGMRAIDYLQSRQDIIADKIGCTGNSGGGGVFVSTSPPPYNGFTLTDFFYKKPPPTAFTPEPVRRRVAGMKQILLMIAVVALVGCGEKDDGNTGVVNPNKTSPKAVPVNIADPIVEKAIRSKLKKPTGELTEADYEKVRYLNLEDYSLTDVKGLEKLTQLKNLYLSGNELTDVKDLERLTNPSKELSLDNGSKEGTT